MIEQGCQSTLVCAERGKKEHFIKKRTAFIPSTVAKAVQYFARSAHSGSSREAVESCNWCRRMPPINLTSCVDYTRPSVTRNATQFYFRTLAHMALKVLCDLSRFYMENAHHD